MSLNITDIGIILSVKKHGESSLIVQLLSKDHGIYSGFIKGAKSSKKNAAIYQIGNLVDFIWRSKVQENMGSFKLELAKSYLAKIIFDNLKLTSICAIFNLIKDNILEREPHKDLFVLLLDFLNNIESEDVSYLSKYVRLEVSLLEMLGYGMDLSVCALTGQKDDLYFVSPKTGRAACKDAGIKYKDKLLRLPQFIMQDVKASKEDVFLGLDLTSFFFKKHLLHENQRFFEARSKMLDLVRRKI